MHIYVYYVVITSVSAIYMWTLGEYTTHFIDKMLASIVFTDFILIWKKIL